MPSSLTLIKPILAKCNNRTQLAKLHPTSGEPQDWLDDSFTSSYEFSTLSFDFFVNWNKNVVSREIWIKRIVDDKYNPWPNDDKNILQNALYTIDGEHYISNIRQFTNIHDFSCHYLLFRDSTDWSKSDAKVVDFDVSSSESSPQILNMGDIEQRIKSMRGQSVPIGPGGLIYGTSSLECYLSRTPYFWPGDVDSVLIDKKSKAFCIIEFKKHTLNDSIKTQTLLNYRDRDKLKYQSLGLLRDRLSVKNKIPLLMVYYPTMTHIKEIKIEKIEGNFNDLKVSSSLYLDLPMVSNKNSCNKFIKSILEII